MPWLPRVGCLSDPPWIEKIIAVIPNPGAGITACDCDPLILVRWPGRGSPSRCIAGVTDLRPLLIIEDDDLTRAFLLDNLAADGFRVAGASSVAEGLRAIEVRQPALVVLDLALEGASGLMLLDRVRAADGLASRLDPDLPVIVLSGRASDADRVRSFARGADDHLCKPNPHLFSAL